MIDVERHGEIAVVHLRAGKANSMNIAVLDAIGHALEEAHDARALVLTGEGTTFSAGLALPELIEFNRRDMALLIDRFEQAMHRVLTFPRATVAAINGHAFAGGCVLALMCDARVMVSGKVLIGLNEVQLGIGLPALVVEGVRARLSPAAFGVVALEGRLFVPEDALRVGLVDEVVDPAALLERALAIASARGAAPAAYSQLKGALLAPALGAWHRTAADQRELWLDTWFSDDAQQLLRAVVDRLAKR